MLNENNTQLMPGMTTSSSITKIAPALLKAQRKMGNAVKDAKNPFYKSSYADLNAVREASMPVLLDEGIMLLQPTVVLGGKQYVRTLLLHESGEFISADTEVVCAKQNDPQALGSAISYARRYGAQSLVCLGSVDDDGEKAMARAPAKVKAVSESAQEFADRVIASRPAPAEPAAPSSITEPQVAIKPVSSFNRNKLKDVSSGTATSSSAPAWS